MGHQTSGAGMRNIVGARVVLGGVGELVSARDGGFVPTADVSAASLSPSHVLFLSPHPIGL